MTARLSVTRGEGGLKCDLSEINIPKDTLRNLIILSFQNNQNKKLSPGAHSP